MLIKWVQDPTAAGGIPTLQTTLAAKISREESQICSGSLYANAYSLLLSVFFLLRSSLIPGKITSDLADKMIALIAEEKNSVRFFRYQWNPGKGSATTGPQAVFIRRDRQLALGDLGHWPRGRRAGGQCRAESGGSARWWLGEGCWPSCQQEASLGLR